jgi:hypothetical protein
VPVNPHALPVTNYIRFFHLQTHRLTFLEVETLVTLVVLLLFVLLPVRSMAFFPDQRFRRFAQQRGRVCVAVFLLSFVGRLALLPIEPFPPPRVQDEFSYLLASETFAHGRWTNPTPPQWHHFEAFHVLMQPTYMSKYGAAAPLFMAFGERFFGTPRVGVLLSMGLATASLCWMLQAYLPAEWALLGGLLAIVRISWFSYFGNGYWGGSVAMLGGCLLLGAAARLARGPRPRYGVLLALALILLANSRPLEGALLALPICSYTLWMLFKKRAAFRILIPGLVVLLGGAVLTGYYCYRVTGRLTFPWVAHWERWGMAPPFLLGKPNYSVQYQFPEQLIYNRDVDMFSYTNLKTKGDFLAEVAAKGVYQWLFFIFPALTLPLIGLIPTWRARKSRVLLYVLALAGSGFIWETWLQAHYFAVCAGILYLILLNGLRWMRVGGRKNIVWLKLMRGTLASIVIMMAVRLIVVPTQGFPTWGTWMNLDGQTPGWQDIHHLIEAKPGKQLVIVRYGPDHLWENDWINNGYDIANQHAIWARDTEPGESNVPLLCAYRDRQVWLLVPPEEGFMPPPDRTAHWNAGAAERFLQPYPMPQPLACGVTRRATETG